MELVVGVRNMAPGDVVPWAPPGARVPGLDAPLATKTIRGVVSNGMLCSPSELAISQDHTGILVLDDTWVPGTDVKGALGLDDPVLDIEVEPNRPDFLSIYGVAREVAAAHRGAPRPARPRPWPRCPTGRTRSRRSGSTSRPRAPGTWRA